MYKFLFVLAVTGMSLITACQSRDHKRGDNEKTSKATYENTAFSFRVRVPADWKIYEDISLDSLDKHAYVYWDLPAESVEDKAKNNPVSVAVRALKKDFIHNVNDLIFHTFLTTDLSTTTLKNEKGLPENARMIYSQSPDGKKYKGKIYFVYKNGTGYVIIYLAPAESYRKYLDDFEEFYKSFEVLE